MDELNQIQNTGWHHWIPFAALMTSPPKGGRPMLTRIIEQGFVAILAGGGSAYGVGSTMQAVHDEQIKVLQQQVRDSEARLTAQIVELRARLLK